MSDSAQEPGTSADEAFVALLTGEQMGLLYYITMLLGDPHAAENVLQDTNLVIWRKAADFQPGTSFSAWSRKVAFWQVKAYVRDRGRDRHVFQEKLIEQLANRSTEQLVEPERRLALRHCLQTLSQANLDLLRGRYEEGLNIAQIASKVAKTEVAVRAALMRIRRTLQRCIESKLPTP